MIKQIDRIRRRRPRYVVLDELSKVPADQHNPSEVAEQQELHDPIVNAIRSLPTPQREVVTLRHVGIARPGPRPSSHSAAHSAIFAA